MKNSNPRKRVIRKPVAFNRNDPEQLKLLEYALSIDNFSGYIKELIRKDLESKKLSNKPLNFSGNGGIKIDLTKGEENN